MEWEPIFHDFTFGDAERETMDCCVCIRKNQRRTEGH